MRDSLGLLSEDLTKEMGVRTPPEVLVEAQIEARNTLDSMLDEAKIQHLDLAQEVESSISEQIDTEEADTEEADSSTETQPTNPTV